MYTDKHGVQYSDDKKTLILINSRMTSEYKVLDGVTTIKGSDGFGHGGCGDINCPIILPDSLITIEDRAFEFAKIDRIVLPNGLQSIGSNAFGQSHIKEIYIPAGVTHIGDGAFSFCDSLVSIVVDPANPIYDSRDNCNAIIETKTNTLIAGCQSTTIPDGVEHIGNQVFEHLKLKSMSIPDSVTNIGDYAFANCGDLVNLEIGKGVKTIGPHALYHCWALKDIHLPNSLTHIGEYAFYDTAITNIDIPNTVTEIGDQAFGDCRYLTSIRIPDSVTRIGDMAFQICEALKSVHIGKGVQTIGVAAFGSFGGNTSVIETITVDPDNPYYDCRGNCNAIIETKTNTLIAGCNLTKIPDDIEHIAAYAFSGRKEIAYLELPKGLKTIGKSAFADCVGLTSVVIPDGVTSMGDAIFDHCRNLVSINIPNGVTGIGKEAFLCCNSLTTIALPESVQSIGEKAFYGCASLITVTLSEGITKIGLYAFQDCEKLVSIIIPASVKEVGWYAFDECNTLSSVMFSGQIDKIGRTFAKCPCLAKIIVPKGTKEHYVKLFQEMEMTSMSKKIREGEPVAVSIQDDGDLIYEDDAKTILHACKPTATKVVIPETVKKINPDAFIDCQELTSITIGLGTKSIKTINKKLFRKCKNLTHLVLGDSITAIGVEAFRVDECAGTGNPNLQSITIPASVKKIGYYAFHSCNKLSEVHIADLAAWCNMEFDGADANPICYDHAFQKYAHHLYLRDEEIHDLVIPEGVTRIQEALFAGCADFTSVTIPNTVTEIGSKAFKACTGLKTVVIPKSVTKIAQDAFDEAVQLIR